MPQPQTHAPLNAERAWRWALILAAGLTVLRLVVLFLGSLELYPDEAQYWLWSRALHWGYVSKPPMIAWLIGATTVFSDSEGWVRLAAPLLHAGAMLALFRVGLRLYGPAVALLAAALWGLMPGVQISALFIATDAPMLAFLALSLWAYVALRQAEAGRARLILAAGLGAAMGLALLSKWAALFMLIGMALHAVLDREARRAWGGWAWAAALGALLVVLAPNLIWQASHGFATLHHTTAVNASWKASSPVHPGLLLKFLLNQLGVFGPIPLGVLIAGAVLYLRRKALAGPDLLLACLALPALALVSVQALIAHATAHWAAASYVAASVLVAAWLVRWRAKGWTIAALAIQGLAAAVILLAIGAPSVVDAVGLSRRLERQRGWAETASVAAGVARGEAAHGGLTAVATEDRYVFNELAYYGRSYFEAPGAPPLTMRPAAQALNEAELSSPLTGALGSRALIVEWADRTKAAALPGDFTQVQPLGRWSITTGPRRARQIDLAVGIDWRGPVSGRPTPP